MPITQVEKIWMDGELVDWADAKIHVLSHALHYGTGVFEGIRAYETARRSGRVAHRRASPPSVPLREALSPGHPVLRRSGRRGDEGRDPRERVAVVLRPAARDPRLRGDGRQSAERAGERHHRRVAVGRVPRRGRARAGRPDQDQQLAPERPELAPVRREGDGPVHQQRAREGGVAEGRLRRGDHAERARLHHRRLGRERLHRSGRRPHHAADRRPDVSTASRAAASSRSRATSATRSARRTWSAPISTTRTSASSPGRPPRSRRSARWTTAR